MKPQQNLKTPPYSWGSEAQAFTLPLTRSSRIYMCIHTYTYIYHQVKSSTDYSFSIKTPGRKWMLNPGTEKAFDEWEQKLLSVLK